MLLYSIYSMRVAILWINLTTEMIFCRINTINTTEFCHAVYKCRMSYVMTYASHSDVVPIWRSIHHNG